MTLKVPTQTQVLFLEFQVPIENLDSAFPFQKTDHQEITRECTGYATKPFDIAALSQELTDVIKKMNV